MKFTRNVRVLAVKRLNNSSLGNPKWEIAYTWIGFPETHSFIGTTGTNAICGYLFGLFSITRAYEITYHFTKYGAIIIDYAKEIKHK